MATVHLLNTKPGDCTIIQHASGRTTMIDVCDGNDPTFSERPAHSPVRRGQRDNFRMCQNTANPIDYARDLGINSLFRFILTHPDMDHMDGFNRLLNELGIANFWDSGSRRPKPNFDNCPYLERDWDRYERTRDGREAGITTLRKLVESYFAFANREQDGAVGGDGLYILAPDQALLDDPNTEDDINEGSYVILYRSVGGRILLPGDAHDASWNYVCAHYNKDVSDCSFLLAPHHGRDSARSYDFLDYVRPKLTLIGCAPSEHIDYDQWYRRDLRFITSNQCGNVVLQADNNVITVWVENVDFAVASGYLADGQPVLNSQGYGFCGTIEAQA
jgi:beta-lactamase superfamily II metal-dependent hydrolase